MKRAQPETDHQSSISNRHQHKHQGITDSPPSSSSEEDIPSYGFKSWLPPKQSTSESLPEFRGCPHQHWPTIDEWSTFRPPVQCQSAHIPILRVLPNNTYGDRPPIHIEHDLEWGLVSIQEEPITVEQPAPTPTNEEDNIGAMYSQQWIQHHLSMAVETLGSLPKHYTDILKMRKEDQELWMIAMKEEIKSLHERKVWNLVDLPKGRQIIKGRWVYAMKSNNHKKAQFVAKGFT